MRQEHASPSLKEENRQKPYVYNFISIRWKRQVVDKILYTDGKGIDVRSDYNGVFLLDTILQTRLNSSEISKEIWKKNGDFV